MKELIILMSWHKEADPGKIAAFEENYSSFKTYNPGVEIITVMNYFTEPKRAWLSTDLVLFNWYINNHECYPARRYLLIEWDCWCDCKIEDYFSRVWDCNLVVPTVKYPERDDWYWFQTINQLPQESRVYATGISPLCAILISDEAMDAISKEINKPEYESLNSEIRFGTIATMLNYDPVVNPVYNRSIGWRFPSPFDNKIPGLHHPRKKITS